MGNFIPVEPEKWAEMVKAAAASDYWRIEAETDHARWLRTLEENEKLRAEVERLTNNCDCLDRELDREIDKTAMLCGQVERLRKAGDAMVELLDHMDVVMDMNSDHPEVEAWNAAKEGKQS